MCNEIRRRIALGQIRDDFSELRIPLRFPEGAPNLEATDSVRITDPTLIVRAAPDGGDPQALLRRWSWAGRQGRPVYNVRSEGQSLKDGQQAGRCLIPADGFYEFTDPPPSEPTRSTTSRRSKVKWLFTHRDDAWFAIGGLWRTVPADPQRDGAAASAERFAMLTCEPGADIAPYHARQIVVVARADWARWLDPGAQVRDLVAPTPAGTLAVERVR